MGKVTDRIESIELVEAAPRTALHETNEDSDKIIFNWRVE